MGDALAIGTLLHGYRIERYIASGGFGNTYLVRHVSLDAVRVMKEFFIRGITGRSTDSLNVSVTLDVNRPLFESQLEKFRGEARRIFGLSHRNVVKVYDLFDENGTAYYVMDYVDGESLQDLVKRRGALPADEIRGYTLQVLDALKAIHSEGIFHLDLKPGNIMIDHQGVLHLIDFGASKQIEADGTAVTTTAAPYTPDYAPPEQINYDKRMIGPATDLYALGATVYNLSTGQKPPTMTVLLSGGEAFAAVPASLREFVGELMKLDPEQRPQSAGAARQLLIGKEEAEVKAETPLKIKVADIKAEIAKGKNETIITDPNKTIITPNRPDFTIENEGDNLIFDVYGVKFRMIYVAAGQYKGGLFSGQKDVNAFYIGQTQVTQALWKAVMGKNPSKFSKNKNNPVERVSCNDCKHFLNKLRNITKRSFRFPTKQEWQFAARGGNYSRGFKYSGSNDIDRVAWYEYNSGGMPHEVALKQPNELGIYDMSGNVWEFSSNQLKLFNTQIILGGCYLNGSGYCEVTSSYDCHNEAHHERIGLRLALSAY